MPTRSMGLLSVTQGDVRLGYPLRFLDRLTEYPRLSVGPGSGLLLWTDAGYEQKRRPVPGGAEMHYADGTVPLQAGQ